MAGVRGAKLEEAWKVGAGSLEAVLPGVGGLHRTTHPNDGYERVKGLQEQKALAQGHQNQSRVAVVGHTAVPEREEVGRAQ